MDVNTATRAELRNGLGQNTLVGCMERMRVKFRAVQIMSLKNRCAVAGMNLTE